jgi:hypothetical protein
VAGAVGGKASIQRLAHALGSGKVVPSPRFAVMGTGVRRNPGEDQQKQP